MVEAGQVLLPVEAPWLAEFTAEVLAFPNGRHDDQVDALSQLLIWVRHRYTYRHNPGSPPEAPGLDDEEDEDDWTLGGDDEAVETDSWY